MAEDVRPLDLSTPKTVFALMLNSLILICIVLGVARWYKKRTVEKAVPKAIRRRGGDVRVMVHDDRSKELRRGRDYKRFAPIMLTVFFFIFVNNLMGRSRSSRAGRTIGQHRRDAGVALCTFLAVNLFGTRSTGEREIFWPEVPAWLKVPVPMMPAVELVGIFYAKPFALMIRLFANMMGPDM